MDRFLFYVNYHKKKLFFSYCPINSEHIKELEAQYCDNVYQGHEQLFPKWFEDRTSKHILENLT